MEYTKIQGVLIPTNIIHTFTDEEFKLFNKGLRKYSKQWCKCVKKCPGDTRLIFYSCLSCNKQIQY